MDQVSPASFYIVLFAILFFIIVDGILVITYLARPAAGYTGYNERQKYTAAALDRLSAALFVGGFLTPQIKLSDAKLGLTPEMTVTFMALVWILPSVALHLMGAIVIQRTRDT